ncbi:MAG: hypothetical protein RR624_01650 [Longicatena sp.]
MRKLISVGLCALLCYGSIRYVQHHEYIHSSTPNELEKNAKISITMDDKKYANGLQMLWNRTYPKQKDALLIKIKPTTFHQHITSDIEWISDFDVPYKELDAYRIDKNMKRSDTKAPPNLMRNEKIFVPVSAKGLVFAYNKRLSKSNDVSSRDFKSMERIQKIKGNRYYHNRLVEYMYPFLFLDYEPMKKESVSMDTIFQEETFLDNLNDYRALSQDLSLRDDPYDKDHYFQKDRYLCGLVDSAILYQKSDGNMQVQAMPTLSGKQLSPIVDTYGFIVNKATSYPNTCLAFLEMVRSFEGMQMLVDQTTQIPMIAEKNIDKFSIYEVQKKDIILAFNKSQLRSTTVLSEKPSICIDTIIQESNMSSNIQNALYSRESSRLVMEALSKDIKKWSYNQ